MSWPIIMHINYFEQGQSIDETCKKAVELGFDGIEFRRRRDSYVEEDEEYLDIISKSVLKYGLKHVIFGYPGPDLTLNEKEKRQVEIQNAVIFYKLAAERFKLTVCNTFSGLLLNPDKKVPYARFDRHGSFAASEKHWEWASEGFEVLAELAGALNFRLAFETHMCFLHDLPVTAKKLVNMIGSPFVGINLDYGNIIYFKDISKSKGSIPSIKDAIAFIGEHLFYIHLKNSVNGIKAWDRNGVDLGDGEINHREYLRLLKESGYNGPVCIEAPRRGDREWYAKQDIDYVKSVINDI